MILVVSGPSGSGKTTVAKSLANKYGLRFVSGGQIFREKATVLGKDLVSLNKEAERDFDIDRIIDQEILNQAKGANVVIESHIAGWILADESTVSVYLWAPLEERAKRISQRDQIPYDKALMTILEREQSHYYRFWKYYGIDIQDTSLYDLVINTSKLTPDKVLGIIEYFLDSYIRLTPGK
ncbi:(d)CMP kinase [Metallosphaera hakonensis]|uniref:Cytidylate kinase n=1 Tax=Metallosphaera hakonensis JCM 8857 = DSM 7519 TaxID=1293036 RepID=A0A2U9ITL2_9CREN|nr:AAA family ATPase [Metallosphaera hakonensis]AWR99389.1 AAA family ATPase [Metallosphaera hakonensis JCM 8857 = DSM 7519]